MSKTGKLKIAISGYLGTGKTTLAQELAARLDLQVVQEGASAISEGEATYRRTQVETGGDAEALKAVKQDLAHRYLEWANARSQAIEEADRVVADRWHVDLLAWWLLSFRGFRGPAETFTARLQNEAARITSQQLDFIVITPLQQPFVTETETNEDGLARKVNATDHFLFQSLITGIMAEVPKSKLIVLPAQPQTVAERVDFIMKAIADADATLTPAVLH